jgi:uncharacterized membrane protein (UPF0127 family)
MIVINKTRSTIIGNNIALADTHLRRLLGLAGRRQLYAGCGLLIRPSSGVHTFGMRFAIDVIALDKSGKVKRIWHRMAPFRVTAINFGTCSVLELAAGEAERHQIYLGDQLEVAEAIAARPFTSVVPSMEQLP